MEAWWAHNPQVTGSKPVFDSVLHFLLLFCYFRRHVPKEALQRPTRPMEVAASSPQAAGAPAPPVLADDVRGEEWAGVEASSAQISTGGGSADISMEDGQRAPAEQAAEPVGNVGDVVGAAAPLAPPVLAEDVSADEWVSIEAAMRAATQQASTCTPSAFDAQTQIPTEDRGDERRGEERGGEGKEKGRKRGGAGGGDEEENGDEERGEGSRRGKRGAGDRSGAGGEERREGMTGDGGGAHISVEDGNRAPPEAAPDVEDLAGAAPTSRMARHRRGGLKVPFPMCLDVGRSLRRMSMASLNQKTKKTKTFANNPTHLPRCPAGDGPSGAGVVRAGAVLHAHARQVGDRCHGRGGFDRHVIS